MSTVSKTVTLPGVTVVGKINLPKSAPKSRRRKRRFPAKPATNTLLDFARRQKSY